MMVRQTSLSRIITNFIATNDGEGNPDVNKGDYFINVANGSKIFLSSGDTLTKYGILIDSNNNVGIGKKPLSELDIQGKLRISQGLTVNDYDIIDNNGNINIPNSLNINDKFIIDNNGDIIIKDNFSIKGLIEIDDLNNLVFPRKCIIKDSLSINDQFKIDQSGNIIVKDILQYGSLNINDNTFFINHATGNLYSQGTIDISGNLKVNDKLLLNASNGDIISSGTLIANNIILKSNRINDISLVGDININGHKIYEDNVNINSNLIVNNKLFFGDDNIIFEKGNIKIFDIKINNEIFYIKSKKIKIEGELNINDKIIIDKEGNLYSKNKFYITNISDNIIIDDYSLFIKNSKFSDDEIILSSKNIKFDGNLDITTLNNSLYIDKFTNNVGIGISSPADTLHVKGNARIDGNLIISGETIKLDINQHNTDQLIITNYGSDSAIKINQSGDTNIAEFQSNGIAVITITNNGNLGINTTSPEENLDINGNAIIRNKLLINELDSIDNKYLNIRGRLSLNDNDDKINIEYINGNFKIDNIFNIDKSSKNISIDGSIYVSDKFSIDGLNGNINILGSLIIGDDILTINPSTNDLKFKDLFIIDGHLKNVKINGSLDVTELISDKLNIIGNLNICNILTVDHENGKTIIGGVLDVCNDAIIYGDLITKNIKVENNNIIIDSHNGKIKSKLLYIDEITNDNKYININGIIRSSGYEVNGFKICDDNGNIFANSIKINTGPLIIDKNNNVNFNNGQLFISNSGKIGINTILPEFELDVYGNINISGDLYQNGIKYLTSQWRENNKNIFYNGNVGIGISNPSEQLHINNGLLIENKDTYFKIKSSEHNYILSNKDIIFGEKLRFSNNCICIGTSIPKAYINIYNDKNIPSLLINNNFIITDKGKIGVGTDTPKSYFDINIDSLDKACHIKQKGLGDIFEVSNKDGTIMYIAENTYVGIGTNVPGAKLDIFDNDENYALKVNQIGSGELMWLLNGIHTRLTVKSDGNIGFGTRDPRANLEISKPGCKKLQFTNDMLTHRQIILWEKEDNEHQFTGIGTDNGSLRYQIHNTNNSHIFYAGTTSKSSDELIRICGNGNVGIGISNPEAKLEISSNNTSLKINQSTGEAININDNLIINSDGITIGKNTYIESPQKDIIYRGKVKLENGKAIVNLNFKINNYDIFLQNNDSFDKVIGKIEENILCITCENNENNDMISWMIVVSKNVI